MPGSALKVEPPALPQATKLYESSFQDQYSNVLRLFFNRLTSSYNAIIDLKNLLEQLGGGGELNFPYGSFYDTTNQTAAATTVAYPVTFNTTAFSNFFTVASGSRITLQILAAGWLAAIYNLQFSIQFKNTSNAQQDIDIWLRRNGVDIPDTNSRFTIHARKNAIVPGYLIAALNFFVDLQLNDYVEIMWCTTDTNVSIAYNAAPVSPTRPAIPSAVVTMTYVSVHD